jgi:hypothetical protein
MSLTCKVSWHLGRRCLADEGERVSRSLSFLAHSSPHFAVLAVFRRARISPAIAVLLLTPCEAATVVNARLRYLSRRQ